MNKKCVEVVAAVIAKEDTILATQRGYGDFKGKWEFPGGKVEDNETLENALIREIKEELNADIIVREYIDTIEYEYHDFILTMHTYLCNLKDGVVNFTYHDENNLEHENMVWLDMANIDYLDWLPADVLAINRLKKNKNILRKIGAI
ncbi:MAG: (deoxy)nucleoside triphosphate pyrophosphohydrolase [Bacilli bacterium]|nr:(deoxy)nucleoside triphosphate pyrophosphohydrolase [Bacilli bacterium]